MGNYFSYNPTEKDRSGEIMAAGITAAAGSLTQGILQGITKRDEAKAADAEFDVMKEMYPEMAQFEDKFHSANLGGKQAILGQGKGYIMRNAEIAEQQRKAQAATTFYDHKTSDGAVITMNGLGQQVHTAQPVDPTIPVPEGLVPNAFYDKKSGIQYGKPPTAPPPFNPPPGLVPNAAYDKANGVQYGRPTVKDVPAFDPATAQLPPGFEVESYNPRTGDMRIRKAKPAPIGTGTVLRTTGLGLYGSP